IPATTVPLDLREVSALDSPLVLREECAGAEERPASGNARPADPQDPRSRAEPRLGDLEPHPPDVARRVEREPRVAVPRAAPTRAAGRRAIRNGPPGEHPPRPSLHDHPRRTPAPRGRTEKLGAVRALDAACPETDDVTAMLSRFLAKLRGILRRR